MIKQLSLVLMSLLLASPTIVEAKDGQLDINHEVIYQNEKKAQQKNVVGFTIENRLFLPEMNTTESKRQKRETKRIVAVKQKNFVTPIKTEKTPAQTVKSTLFTKNYQPVEGIVTGTHQQKSDPWLVYLSYFGLGLGGLLVVIVGVRLGHIHYINDIKRKNEMETKQTDITIGLHLQNKIYDLKIPIQVSVERLKELLVEVLPDLGASDDFRIGVLNKPITLQDSMLVSAYPLANGDQLEIIRNGE